MRSRYGALAIYSALLACLAAGTLSMALLRGVTFPPWWVVLLGIGACLFVWQFGLRAPRLGLISMERLPQIGLLLVFEPAIAATICAAASLTWPLVSRRYSQGSLKVAALRAIHNASMTALMLMLAGYVYLAAGGRHPLTGLVATDFVPLIAMALTAQILNVGLMMLFFRFDGRDVRRIVTASYALSDLIFVPAGVLAAVLYNTGSIAVFGLFAGLMLLFVLSFNSIGTQRDPVPAERGPMTRLFEARLALRGARRIDELAERILTETRTLFRFDEFYLVLVDRERRQLDIRVHERQQVRLPRRVKPIDSGLFGGVVARAEPLLVDDWQHAPAELKQRAETTEKSTGSLLAMPLVNDGIVLGLLCVQHTQAGNYSSADLHLMRQLGEQVAGALADARAFEDLENYRRHLEERVTERTAELEKANVEKERLIAMLRERSLRLERESQEDALTGVANRRCFMQRLAAEIEVALAVGQPLSVAIADLDHFKAVNDELGHPVGDQALRQSAALMRRSCGQGDLVARVGGEEFALVLPGMTRADATAFCETLRAAVAEHDWREIHPDLAITISIGLAQWDGSAELDELVHMADAQLYRAKRAGRNQVA
ncbi:MAG TPA: sensor domain-containing diguanylate cyclase [Steroidobacteraceae bacterium]|nr:sensor domain-containing diguanylate cyclase [Steroidobacteraceae bacterium]